MNLAELAAAAGRDAADAEACSEIADIITFVESDWGLGLILYPIQRIILKAHYGVALDDNEYGFPLEDVVPPDHPHYDPDLLDEDGFYKHRIEVTDWRRENRQYFTEAGYLAWIHEQGRSNIKKVVPGQQRREMVLAIGRRSGKTLITSCVVAYETYKLLNKSDPQKFYGVSGSNVIQLISIATDRDQAGLLFRESKGHFTGCTFYLPYTANNTQTMYSFQSGSDIERFGSYKDNQKAPFSVLVTFRSCVAKGLRGGNNILVALDEVAHFGEHGQASADEVYQAVAPSTRTFSPKNPNNKSKVRRDSDGKPMQNEGRIIMISSPMGKRGLFYKQFRFGFGDNKATENFICIQAPTWEVNPTIPAETFIADYLRDPTVFFTEFGAEFTDRTRGWLEDPADLLSCIEPTHRPRFRAPPRAPHFMGLDVALVGDYSAIAIGHNDSEGRVVLDYIERIRAGEGEYKGYDRLEFEDVADWVFALSKRFYIVSGIFDQWAGIPMEQALARRGMKQMKSVHFTDKLGSMVYQNFKNLMLDRKLLLFDWPINPEMGEEHCDYIQELMELQAEHKSKYVIKVEAPNMDGKHDDFSDALVRMVWCATQNTTRRHQVTGLRTFGDRDSQSLSRFGRNPVQGGLSGQGSHPSRSVRTSKIRGGGGRR